MQLVDLKNFSRQTSLSVYTLRKYIKSHSMPCYRVGRKILINPEECEAWFEQFKSVPIAEQQKSLRERVNEVLRRSHLST